MKMFNIRFRTLLIAVILSATLAFRFIMPIRQQSIQPSVLHALSDSQRESAMSIDDLKSELEMRGVDYSECTSKQELVNKLIASRATGVANADNVFEKFNEFKDIEVTEEMLDSELVKDAVADDGTLPGGLPPDLMKALASDPEIMSFLREPKMQEIMKAVMGGGPDALKKYMSDPDAIRMLDRLSRAIQRTQTAKPSQSRVTELEDRPDENILQ